MKFALHENGKYVSSQLRLIVIVSLIENNLED